MAVRTREKNLVREDREYVGIVVISGARARQGLAENVVIFLNRLGD